jgi:hypothetical protein
VRCRACQRVAAPPNLAVFKEAAATAVLDRISRLVAGMRLLVVSGASGAGKSSLLRAGVLPRLRADGLAAGPGAARWPRVVFTPTRAPLDELALRVAPLAGADAAAVRRGLDTAPAWFALTARQAALPGRSGPAGDPDGRPARPGPWRPRRLLLVVVDQFEELFTQCDQEGQRRAFITALHAAATAGHGPDQAPAALVVLAVRADYEARCADYPQLAGPVQDRYLVTAMTERQLRMAITEPAKKADSKVDDALTDLLLAEVRTGQPGTFGAGVLPLLSHALDQAWRSRPGQTLTLADYERTGGIDGAVAASAQRAYDRLTPGQQAAARQVFTRLTATSADGADTADRATRAELTEGKSPAEAQDTETVLEAFAAERLLTLAAGTVELSHEALLTAWPLLRDSWLADTHADRIVRSRLHTIAADWERQSRDPSYLYSGSLLQAATDTAARTGADPARHPPLSQTERDFLHAGVQSRRHAAGQRRWRRHGAAVEPGHRPPRRRAPADWLRPCWRRGSGGVQPRRHAAGQRRRRRGGAAVEPGHPPARRRAHPGRRRRQRRARGGIQPRRHAAGQRRERRRRAAVAAIAIRACLCGALRLRRTTDTARMEAVRLRRTAAENLRLNGEHTDFLTFVTSLHAERSCPARVPDRSRVSLKHHRRSQRQ